MKTAIKNIEIIESMYSSTKNFVYHNSLKKEANKLFGKGWESEDDCDQIERLLESIGASFYEVEFIEGLDTDEDIKVWYNSFAKECFELKEEIKKQKECISKVLDTLYSLEDVYEYDETSTGKQIGECVNILQDIL